MLTTQGWQVMDMCSWTSPHCNHFNVTAAVRGSGLPLMEEVRQVAEALAWKQAARHELGGGLEVGREAGCAP